MARQPRRGIIRMERRLVANRPGEKAAWLIVHYTYSDAREVYEVHALDRSFPTQKFRLQTEVQHYLRRHGYREPQAKPSTSSRL